MHHCITSARIQVSFTWGMFKRKQDADLCVCVHICVCMCVYDQLIFYKVKKQSNEERLIFPTNDTGTVQTKPKNTQSPCLITKHRP